MVGTRRGQGIAPLREIRNKEGSRKSQVYNSWSAHEGHRKPGVDPGRVEE